MSNVLIAVLFTVCALGFCVCLWIASWIDPYRTRRVEKRHREQWIADWDAYRQSHPDADLKRYIQQHAEDKPMSLTWEEQSVRRLEPWFQLLMGLCVIGAAVLVYWAMASDRGSEGLALYMAILVAVCFVWFGLVLEQKVSFRWHWRGQERQKEKDILPTYAQGGYDFHDQQPRPQG